MRNLFKCHFAYLLNRKSILIFIIVNAFVILYFYSNKDCQPTSNFENYYQTAIIMIKVSFSFITIYLLAISIYKQNDYYIFYLLTSNISRSQYIISKLLLILFIVFIDFCLLLIAFLYIGFLFNPGFYFKAMFLWGFLATYFIVIIYGLYAMLLMQLFQNFFVIVIPFMLLIMTNDIDLENTLANLIVIIFPVLRSFNFYHCLNLLWLIFMLVYLNIKIYCYKDLNY